MSILRTLKGIATELLDLDVKAEHVHTNTEYAGRDNNGYSIYNITASNYERAARLSDGYTVAGPVYKSLVHVGYNKWELRVECNDTYTRE